MEEIRKGVRRALLLQKSGVNNVFTPHTPIKKHQNLIGRSNLATKLIECLIKPGHHSLLFGDRGVGKSSLANAVSDVVLKELFTGKIIKKGCDSTDTLASIMEEPLRMAGINLDLHQKNEDVEVYAEGAVNIKAPLVEGSGKVGGKLKKGEVLQFDHNTISPSWVGDKIKDLSCLIVIDEFDAISSNAEKHKVAELLKYLSDNTETVNVMIVGIGESADDLTAGHPSVGRCLMELHVDRMDELELRKIIIDGTHKLGLIFQDDVVDKIVSISAGYPYFTHLISLKCSEEALVSGTKHIKLNHLDDALKLAVESAKSSIGTAYYAAIRGNKSAEYKRVLLASASCNESEFSVRDIAKQLSMLLGVEVESTSFTRFMQANTSSDNSKIFRRIRQGVYQFSDPRMPSFIHMAADV
jgi:Cdc6-like AAA superfamily ATPase